MIRPLAALLAVNVLIAAGAAADVKLDYSDAYHDCTTAFQQSADDIEPVLKKCEEPARMGVPGAQYAMGALLANRATGDDLAKGTAWLEKAVAAGSIPAAYHLASLMVVREDEASIARGRELFRSAVCAGYPPALENLANAGVSKESFACTADPRSDFDGEWIVSLKWDPAKDSDAPVESYKLSIHGDQAHVFLKVDGEWVEAKPGRFTFARLDQTATIAVTDSGWDFDGEWIESWTIQLMRLSPDESAVAYLRTVNNPHLPSQLAWRTFAKFAEGKARRVGP